MNRSLIEGDPHAVLEGMLIAAYAIGATQGYVYIRAEYPLAIRRLLSAIAAMRRLGLLGANILGSDFSFDITVKEGAGAFVCGEETALIASIEGRRGMPRTRPPYPAVSGLWGKPTIIDNVETLATLPAIITNGAGVVLRLRHGHIAGHQDVQSCGQGRALGACRGSVRDDPPADGLRHRRGPRKGVPSRADRRPVGRLPGRERPSIRRSSTRAWPRPARS